MADGFVSPGVFTEERDLTFLPQGIQDIAGAFIGPTSKGPAFEPVLVDSPQDYRNKFGNEGFYTDFATQNYLQDAGSAWVVRLLGEDGYQSESVEIQLPEGELSKNAFEVDSASWSFEENDRIAPGDSLSVFACVRGLQPRLSEEEIQDYTIEIEEYVDGEFNTVVYSKSIDSEDQGSDANCFLATFSPDTGDYAEVNYVLNLELEDGQTTQFSSPTATLEGFRINTVYYNWDDLEARGLGETVSLQALVDNPGGAFNWQVCEVIDGELGNVVAEDTGESDDLFEADWILGGGDSQAAIGDDVRYILEVEQGDTVDVPASLSPAIQPVEREALSGFGFQDINFNFDAGQLVDYQRTLQIDWTVGGRDGTVYDLEVREIVNGGTPSTVTTVTGISPDTDTLTFDLGDGGADMSTGDNISYEVEITETGSGDTATASSPAVELDENIFQIDAVNWNVPDDSAGSGQNDLRFDVDGNASVQFTVQDLSTTYDYEVFEVINGSVNTTTPAASGTGVSDTEVETELVPPTSPLTGGDEIEFQLEVETSSPVTSTDTATSPSRDAEDISDLGQIGFKTVRFPFESGSIDAGEDLFVDFFIDGDGETDLDYEIEVVTVDDDGNETPTGQTAASATAVDTTTAGEAFFETWSVNSSGAAIFDGDDFFYRIKLLDTTDTLQAEFDSPTLTLDGPLEQVFQLLDYDFKFGAGDGAEPGERFTVSFDLFNPDDDNFNYRVVEVRGDGTEQTVVEKLDVDEAEADETIDVSWFSEVTLNNDTVSYRLEIEERDGSGGIDQTITRESIELDVTEPNPRTDVTLAVLSPTQRLREDGNEILDAQINPERADITDFELILDIDGGGSMASTSSTDDDLSEKEALLQDSGAGPIAPTLISGESFVISLREGDSNYILDLFGSEPEGVREAFVNAKFPEAWTELVEEELGEAGINLEAEYDGAQLDFEDQGFSGAETPWIVSQDQQPEIGEITDRQRLFRFQTIGDGDASNREVKVSIQNIRYAGDVVGSDYGEFDVVVRAFDDNDRSPEILETFTGVNLDPGDPQYIAQVIGNRRRIFGEDGKIRNEGAYENNSEFIRVIMSEELVKANENGRDELSGLVPWGFESYRVPFDYNSQTPHGVKFRQFQSVTDAEYDSLPDGGLEPDTSTVGEPFDNRIHFGFDFSWEGNETFLQAISNNADSTTDQSVMNQDYNFVLSDAYVRDPATGGLRAIEFGNDEDEGFPVSRRKFSVGFQGGFDGKDPAKPVALDEDITPQNTQGFDASTFDAPGTQAYERALETISNDDLFDINLVVTPGILQSQHPSVVESGIETVEQRADAFYVFDAAGVDATIDQAIDSVQTVNTNFAGTYFPWLRIQDQAENRQVSVPPSVLIPRVYAFNDRVGNEWSAPAGLERGGIPEAIETVLPLRRAERDELYAERINPIAQFPDQGVVAWGQKTLQARPGSLDRINVRRLLIRVKKFIASTTRFLVFEQNVPETRTRFLNTVNPFLESVQQRNGLFAFRVKMDADNNPPEVIDRNQLVGEIFLQPTRTAEFISLTFNLLPTGAEFEDL